MVDRSGSSRELPDLESSEVQLPAVMSANEKRVKKGFWRKLGRVAGHLPFASTLVASYYCATDPATPIKAKAILFAALAYFVLPFDVVPDLIAMLGYADDAAVLYAALNLIGIYMKPEHYEKAEAALARLRKGDDPATA